MLFAAVLIWFISTGDYSRPAIHNALIFIVCAVSLQGGQLVLLLPARAAVQSRMMMSTFRGPWTPSTRWSSISEVADGPENIVTGCP